MAKIKVSGISEAAKKLSRNIRIELNKVLRNKTLRNSIGEIVVKDIRANYSKTPSPITKIFREFFEQFNQTHPDYNRNNINITFTGKLLDDLAKNVRADTNNISFVIEHSDKKHPSYKSGEGQKVRGKKLMMTSLKSKKTRQVDTAFSQSEYTHKEISEFLLKQGHNYFILSKEASDKITKLIRDELFKLLTNI